jgi:hypothetical protein
VTVILFPEGVEASLQVFLRSDKLDMDCRLTLSGMKSFVPPREDVNVPLLVKNAKLTAAEDWRLMTNAEIVAYKKEHGE